MDISSRAVLFATDAQPPIGSTIEATVQWPVQVGDETPLRLIVSGPVLRRDLRGVVALIKRFEFVRKAPSGPESGAAESEAEGAEAGQTG